MKTRRRSSRSPARPPSSSSHEPHRVGVHHPLQVRPGEAQVFLDVRQSDRDDGRSRVRTISSAVAMTASATPSRRGACAAARRLLLQRQA